MSFEQLKCALFPNSRPGKTYLKKVCFYQEAVIIGSVKYASKMSAYGGEASMFAFV